MPLELKPEGPLSSQEIMEHIKDCCSEFGHYTFLDKGPDEVCDVKNLLRRAAAMPPTELAKVLDELNAQGPSSDGAYITDYIINNLPEKYIDLLPEYLF